MLVVVSEAHVRSPWLLPRFVPLSGAAVTDARATPGCLGARIHVDHDDLGRVTWTEARAALARATSARPADS
ncbi:MAG: hypothetical protein H6742_22215 [Alphaproteobacteria bacterium]|nr:hypothetical protein [Alphaproteobacteria bacterium]